MKKRNIISIILIVFIFLTAISFNLVSSQNEEGPVTPGDLAKVEGYADRITDFTNDPSTISSNASSYLSQEWEKILLKNEILGKGYLFAKNLDPVFNFIFGEPFTFSIAFLVIIILWVYFAGIFTYLIRGFLRKYDKFPIPHLIGMFICVILARFDFFRGLVRVIDFLIFKPDTWWLRIVMAIFIIIILIGLKLGIKYTSKIVYVWKNFKKKRKEKLAQKKIEATAKGLEEGAKEAEDKD